MSEQDASAHPALRDLSRPIYGYAGVIDERIDFENVRRLAEGEGNVVFVGPFENIDPVVLPRRANIHFTGALDEDQVEAFRAGFDVAIEPFVTEPVNEDASELGI